jgi:hypothetical protein
MPGMVEYELFKFRRDAERLIESHRLKIKNSLNRKYSGIGVILFVIFFLLLYLSFKGKPEPSMTALYIYLLSDLALVGYLISGRLKMGKVKKLPPEEFNDEDFDNLVSDLKSNTLTEVNRLISFIKPPGGSKLYDYSKLLETLEEFGSALAQGE